MSTPPPAEEKLFTKEQVEKHNDRDDLWMVIKGKVYDVTKFVDEHPGGEEVLVDCAGKDATSEFEDVGHSEDAEEILTNLLIGNADPNDFAQSKKSAKVNVGLAEDQGGSSSFVYLIIAALVAAGAFFFLQTN
ncbi:cytochrome b5 [Trichomonascus vanleenenianus]|uniref:Cyb5p n=1 Tax=Trichomonascus vanleenenianus TaxID=2268995 RepID=UPI003EC99DDC